MKFYHSTCRNEEVTSNYPTLVISLTCLLWWTLPFHSLQKLSSKTWPLRDPMLAISRDLFVPASAMVEFQSNFNIHVQVFPIIQYYHALLQTNNSIKNYQKDANRIKRIKCHLRPNWSRYLSFEHVNFIASPSAMVSSFSQRETRLTFFVWTLFSLFIVDPMTFNNTKSSFVIFSFVFYEEKINGSRQIFPFLIEMPSLRHLV